MADNSGKSEADLFADPLTDRSPQELVPGRGQQGVVGGPDPEVSAVLVQLEHNIVEGGKQSLEAGVTIGPHFGGPPGPRTFIDAPLYPGPGALAAGSWSALTWRTVVQGPPSCVSVVNMAIDMVGNKARGVSFGWAQSTGIPRAPRLCWASVGRGALYVREQGERSRARTARWLPNRCPSTASRPILVGACLGKGSSTWCSPR